MVRKFICSNDDENDNKCGNLLPYDKACLIYCMVIVITMAISYIDKQNKYYIY